MSITNNFQVKNGISVNGLQVIDSNANGTFNTVTTNNLVATANSFSANTLTANTLNSNNLTANNLLVNGNLSVSNLNFTVYDLDDLSYKADGFTNTFRLSYNQKTVSISSPFVIDVTVNGLLQPAFDYKYDTFWLSGVLTASKGYCIDNVGNPTSNGYLKFADCPPPNSQILVRTKVGYPNPTVKTYPFKPLDIIMGY